MIRDDGVEHSDHRQVTIDGKTKTAMNRLILVMSIRKTPISKNAWVEAPINANPATNDEAAAKSTGTPTIDVTALKKTKLH
ncbi:unnamed protein product [Gongylonema pulchrum]|uniref:Uncharacterized protein n=1 Tax=Gongylonema pulchrum TaxID=637853 RepID=A0A183D170_9BILA|nr:unnamed protein product [Gongylonema pulchrum]